MVTVHHLYWPRRDYQTELERRFRTLPWNKVEMPAAAHELLHRCGAPPRKPSPEEMLDAIEVYDLTERQRRAERLLLMHAQRAKRPRSA